MKPISEADPEDVEKIMIKIKKTSVGAERKRLRSWAQWSAPETLRPAFPKIPPDEASSTSSKILSILKVQSSFLMNIKPTTLFGGICPIP